MHDDTLYSVDRFLSSIHNPQTKYRCLSLLRLRNATQSSVGFMYRHGVFKLTYIY